MDYDKEVIESLQQYAIDLRSGIDAQPGTDIAKINLHASWKRGNAKAHFDALMKAHGVGMTWDALPKPRFEVMTVGAFLEHQEEVEPPLLEIPGAGVVLPGSGFGMLFGKPGSGKSFVALEWSMRVARRGLPVVYILLEGKAGFARRVLAWEAYHGALPDVIFIALDRTAAPFAPENIDSLIARVALHSPTLVVIDTLTMAYAGAVKDESSATEMGAFLTSIRQLGGFTLLVHHTRKIDTEYRGSTVLEGAMDAIWFVEAKDGGRRFELASKKAKDTAMPDPFAYYVNESADSLALEIEVGPALHKRILSDTDTDILRSIAAGANTNPELTEETGFSRETAQKRTNALEKRGLIQIDKTGWNSKRHYTITDAGLSELGEAAPADNDRLPAPKQTDMGLPLLE